MFAISSEASSSTLLGFGEVVDALPKIEAATVAPQGVQFDFSEFDQSVHFFIFFIFCYGCYLCLCREIETIERRKQQVFQISSVVTFKFK